VTAPSHVEAERSIEIQDLTVGDLLRSAAADRPDGLALVEGIADGPGRRWTFAELLGDAESYARGLLGRFEPGDHVAVWMPNCPEWLLLQYGMALAGLVQVTVNPAYRPKELAWVLGQSESRGVIYVPQYRGSPMGQYLDEVRPELPALTDAVTLDELDDWFGDASDDRPLPWVEPTASVQIQYTSGTTGFSKGVLLRHRSVVNNSRTFMERSGAPDGAVYLNSMPLFHTGGCVQGALGTLWRRAAQVLMTPGFDPELALDLVERERVSVLVGVPTMLLAMLERPSFPDRDVSSVQVVVTGGAQVLPEVVRKVEQSFGAGITNTYGQTEASPVITQSSPQDSVEDKAFTVGRPLPQVELKLVDPDGGTVPLGEPGEVCSRGYSVMAGYYRMPERTAETIDSEGWLHTGDLGVLDSRGYLSIVGRTRDMIIRGGENIYPVEIEAALAEHPAIGDSAVIGAADPKWGEVLVGYVRFTPGKTAADAELVDFLRERLSPHKVPRVWRTLEEFPRTPSGKIQKFRLREMFDEQRSADG
jgi:fatty-acyl-CoA synthase